MFRTRARKCAPARRVEALEPASSGPISPLQDAQHGGERRRAERRPDRAARASNSSRPGKGHGAVEIDAAQVHRPHGKVVSLPGDASSTSSREVASAAGRALLLEARTLETVAAGRTAASSPSSTRLEIGKVRRDALGGDAQGLDELRDRRRRRCPYRRHCSSLRRGSRGIAARGASSPSSSTSRARARRTQDLHRLDRRRRRRRTSRSSCT